MVDKSLVPVVSSIDEDRVNTMRAAAQSVSIPDSATASSAAEKVFGLFRSYAPLGYSLPFHMLDYIELLALWNPDYSQAVDNIKTLANSGHDLFVDHTSSNKAEKIKALLEEKARTIQAQHGGIDGLIGKLLNQGAVYGAMCGEWVLTENLDDVLEFCDINPKTVRFFWEVDGNDWNPYPHWAPYQKVTGRQLQEARDRGQKVLGDCVQLNELTFHYYAFDAAPGSPYGVPPFLAALQPIGVQKDMVDNLSKIVKKVGLLSIVDVKIDALQKSPSESDSEYIARASKYLTDYATAIERMVSEGGLAHFDDAEVSLSSISGNAAGASAIFKQNEELVFSGLKSMPSVQGRSYSTTETYAGVAYDIIIRNTYKYQRAAKRMIEAGYWLMATVWGENPTGIRLEFHSNKSLHRLQDAQSRLLEIKVALMLWASGVLDQLGFAQELGYSAVKTDYTNVPKDPILGNTSPGGGGSSTSTDTGTGTPPRSDGNPQGGMADMIAQQMRAELAEIQETLQGVLASVS